MANSSSSSAELHVFFLPYLAPGHMIPVADLARAFAARGVKSSVVTTAGNAPLLRPAIDSSNDPNIQLLILDAPPSPFENVTDLPTPEPTPDFLAFVDSLKLPFSNLVAQHRPDCIVSDILLPWSADLGITRVAFNATSAFYIVVFPIAARLFASAAADDEQPLLLAGIPHRIQMMRSELAETTEASGELTARIIDSFSRTRGMVLNTFRELEADYARLMPVKAWNVGPIALHGGGGGDSLALRGGESARGRECLDWLDSKEEGSVLYVSFGSVGRFTPAQLREMALGLEASGRPFVWVIKNRGGKAEGALPEGFVEKVAGKGLIVTGWVPQVLVLGHPAVGGFMTHCGWNSCVEAACAGLPMIAWPLFADHFFNEKLIVDVLRIGVSVGVKVCSYDEERRTFVKGEEVKRAIDELMGSSEEAKERRKRAKEVAEMAGKAVEEGGSSCNDMNMLIKELMDAKQADKRD